MKAFYLILFSLFLNGMVLMAKDPFPKNKNLKPGPFRKPLTERESKFAVKLNLTQLILPNLTMQAEWAFHRNMSIGIGASYLPKRTLPSEIYNIEGNPFPSNFSAPVYEGKSITPEFRFYPFGRVGHSAPNGFYLAAYMRFADYNAHQTVSYQDFSSPGSPVYSARATHRYTGKNAGLMIGKQWIIARYLSIDLWILGGGYGEAKYTYTWQVDGVNLTEEQQAYVKEQANQNLRNFSLFGISPSVETTSNSAFMKALLPMYSIRFMGICVGFAF